MKKLLIVVIFSLVLTGCGQDVKRGTENVERGAENMEQGTQSMEQKEGVLEATEQKDEENGSQTKENKQTYRNEEYGFEFQYPEYLIFKDDVFWTEDNLRYSEEENKDSLVAPEFFLNIRSLNKNTIDDIIVHSQLISREYYNKNKEEILKNKNIEGTDFIQVQNIDQSGCNYYIEDNNNLIQFSTIYNCNNKNNLLEEVLKSFKFIDSDWQIYRNEKYSYAINYPDNILFDKADIVGGAPLLDSQDVHFVINNPDYGKTGLVSFMGIELVTLNEEDKNTKIDEIISVIVDNYDNKENIEVSGKDAVKVIFSKDKKGKIQINSPLNSDNSIRGSLVESDDEYIFIKEGKNLYIIRFHITDSDQDGEKSLKLFKIIFSTFTFTK